MTRLALSLIISLLALSPLSVRAQGTITLDANSLRPSAEVFFSPRNGSFTEGSTFEVPILINTNGSSINGIELNIRFDPNKLTIINPSGGKSIVGIWVEPPSYDNTRGVVRLVGVIPDGIVTNSGLIATMTFKVRATGSALLNFATNSQILLNDGQGSQVKTDFGRATYTLTAQAPEGLRVFSDTHPFQDHWYNNKSPILSWETESGVTGFSFEMDNKPLTTPSETVKTKEMTQAYSNLSDGLWYFHLRASKGNVWGNTTHFTVRIDSTPPAEFTPTVNYLAASIITNRYLISFNTTDALSGIDHFEVGVIDRSADPNASPIFIQTESPYQIPDNATGKLHVIVRAFDKAGNVRDAEIDIAPEIPLFAFIKKYSLPLLILIILLILLGMLLHYLIGHHIIGRFKRAYAYMGKDETPPMQAEASVVQMPPLEDPELVEGPPVPPPSPPPPPPTPPPQINEPPTYTYRTPPPSDSDNDPYEG